MSNLKPRPKGDALAQEAMRDEYLLCRTVLHGWEEATADDMERPGDGWRFSLRCFRCGTWRHDIISFKTGELARRHYDYPDGYQIDEKVTRSELRMEFARRRDYDFLRINEKKRKAK